MTKVDDARAWLKHCIGCGGEHVENLLAELAKATVCNQCRTRPADICDECHDEALMAEAMGDDL